MLLELSDTVRSHESTVRSFAMTYARPLLAVPRVVSRLCPGGARIDAECYLSA